MKQRIKAPLNSDDVVIKCRSVLDAKSVRREEQKTSSRLRKEAEYDLDSYTRGDDLPSRQVTEVSRNQRCGKLHDHVVLQKCSMKAPLKWRTSSNGMKLS